MIKLNVNSQKLELIETSYLANKSHNYLKLQFNFETSDWDDKQIFCLVVSHKQVTNQFPVEEGIVILPGSVLTGKHFKISLYGATAAERITTNQLRIKLAESGYTQEVSPIDPSRGKDVFQLIFERLDTKVNLEDIDLVLDADSNNPISNSAVVEALETKAYVGHSHTADDVTGVDVVSGVEIKRAYQMLANKIRTYGQ